MIRRFPTPQEGGGGTEEDLYDEEENLLRERGRRGRDKRKPRRALKRTPASEGSTEFVEGLVVTRSRRRFVVRTSGADLDCDLSGRLQGEEQPVVGDRVRLRVRQAEEGVIEDILPRKNTLSRVSEDEDSRTRTIAANIDRLFAVLSLSPYPPRWALADRLLALAEIEGYESLIVLNKTDLIDPGSDQWKQVEEDAEVYRGLGIPVLFTSALEGDGVEALREHLSGSISILSGHSGVGKSSLLNAIEPGWELAVGRVNPMTRKGRHTTTSTRLLALPGDGYVVDTPGFREFGLGQFEAAELGRLYREFRPIIGECRFSNCLHVDEPGCALREAVEAGNLSRLRYDNYLMIVKGL